ncbi:putative cell wall-binding protein, partial [Arthrobacter sp. UYCu511]
LPAATKTELSRLKPKRIIILGGTGALNNTVQSELALYVR